MSKDRDTAVLEKQKANDAAILAEGEMINCSRQMKICGVTSLVFKN